MAPAPQWCMCSDDESADLDCRARRPSGEWAELLYLSSPFSASGMYSLQFDSIGQHIYESTLHTTFHQLLHFTHHDWP